MTPVVIVGAGNAGKTLYDCLQGDANYTAVAFIDDALAGTECFGLPVYLGGPLRYTEGFGSPLGNVIALAERFAKRLAVLERSPPVK